MKNHKRVNGQLLQTNKTFRQLKQKQKIKINDWMFEAYHNQYLATGRYPGPKEDYKIVANVLEKIEEAKIWIPDYEIEERYEKVKLKLKKRLNGEIIREQTSKLYLEMLPFAFSICKVENYSFVDLDNPYCFIGNTEDQKSVICPDTMVPRNTVSRSDGWKAIRIHVDKSPYRVNVAARISDVFMKRDIQFLFISTFDYDFVFVRAATADKTIEVLKNSSFRFDTK